MQARVLKANLILFSAALLWGTTFVAQRVGNEHLGPITYTGVRFSLGALFLLPFALNRRKKAREQGRPVSPPGVWLRGALVAGLAMFAGINLQQIGLVTTTAGNAGFITGLYVILVPILGRLWGIRPGAGVWAGALMGAVGLYYLSGAGVTAFTPGDGWVLACALAWAAHCWILGWFSPRMDTYVLACGQASVCAVLSLIAAAVWETIDPAAILTAALPIVWGGIMSVGVGFTLQVLGQKDSPPTHAAIILSMESVVAAISGWLMLGEAMTGRSAFGAVLMLAGMLVAQLWALKAQPAVA